MDKIIKKLEKYSNESYMGNCIAFLIAFDINDKDIFTGFIHWLLPIILKNTPRSLVQWILP